MNPVHNTNAFFLPDTKKNQYRIYALKDDPNQVVKARHKLTRMRIGSQITQTLFFILLFYFLLGGTNIEQSALSAIQKLATNLATMISFNSISALVDAPTEAAATTTTVLNGGQ